MTLTHSIVTYAVNPNRQVFLYLHLSPQYALHQPLWRKTKPSIALTTMVPVINLSLLEGKLEVDFAFDAAADAAVASGLAASSSIDKFLLETSRMGIYGFV